LGATDSGIPGACGGTPYDVWYSFTTPSGCTAVDILLTVNGAGGSNIDNTNTYVQAFSGANCSVTAIGLCTAMGSTLSLTGLSQSTNYHLRVYTTSNPNSGNSNAWNYNLCITYVPPPANDECSGAITLTSATSCSNTSGTIVNATASTGLPVGCETGGTHNDVWYRFVASGTTHTISISGQGTNFTSPEIQLYGGTCGSLTSIGCGITSLTSSSLTNGSAYYVRVSNVGSSPATNGGFNICVTHPTPPPSNDDCAGAVTLTSATNCSNTAGTLVSATATAGLPVGCEPAGTHYDVWYKFVASNTTHAVTISGQGTNFTNARIQLYSGTCGALNSDTCGNTLLSSTTLTSGITYYIRVSNVGSNIVSNGGFNICVTHPPASIIVAGGRMNEVYKQTVLSGSGMLQYPWEVTYGPDNNLWITEARGYKVYRMDPNTGAKATVLDISMGSSWLPSPADSLNVQFNSGWPQGGLAGLAIHPNFLDGTGTNDYVFISYVHRNLGGSSPSGLLFRNKLVRFTYNSGTNRLESPIVLCDTLPGSNDHNSQRMIIVPVSGTNYLFYASGDMGSGQFGNRLRAQKAQNPASYEGKILRFNLVSDGDAGGNAWIPNDNPYSPTSAVWNIGIRNNQGFAYNPDLNVLYGSSHGAYSDDEINIIEPFKNYGHPLIIGYADGNYNGNSVQGTNTSVSAGAPWTDNSGISTCPPVGSEAANKTAIDASGNGLYKDPLFSAYAVSQATITNIWQTNPGNGGWPSEGWSGLDLYTNKIVPGWKNSLIAASLKWGRLVRLKLNAAGTQTMPNNSANDTISYFGSQNRFRDLAFSPNGKDIFVVMDNNSTTSGPGSANPIVPSCAGCVQKYTFLGYNDVAGKSSIPASIDVTDAAVNTCNAGTTITIDNTNNNLWVPITGPDGNIMAEIHANGNNLGTVTSSFYKNAGAIRIANTVHYLDRNMTITPQTQPSSTVKVRLYISKAELDSLIADGGSGVTAIGNLKILKNNDPCSNAVTNSTIEIVPTYAEAHGANGYMLQADITSFSSFYFAANNFTLPLDLLSFTGQLQNDNTVLLTWKTENEVNTSHFAVERSTDGTRFNGIGNVTANGRNNTGGTFNYSLTDNDAINQTSQKLYYRLKLVDIDGTYKYSNVVSVSMPLITGKLTISPNPVISDMKVTLTSIADGKVQWKLVDNVGRIIMKGTEQVKKGNGNNFTINMNRLPAGTYSLNVMGAGIDQKVKLQKL
jgi:PQQ-dependent dehydrogenase (s-GDH family)